MRRSLGFIFCGVLLLVACDSYKHAAVSGDTLKQMESLTLTETEAKTILSGEGDMVIRASGPDVVVLPMHFHGRLPAIDVSINSRMPTRVVVDTGATMTVLEAKTAVKNGLKLLPASMIQLDTRGIAGTETMRGAITQLVAGPLKWENIPVLIRTHENQMQSLGGLLKESMGVNLLGVQTISRTCSWMQLDYRSRTVTFGLRGLYPQVSGPKSWSVPLGLHRGVATVELSSGGRSWETIVDTGSSFGIEITADLAKTLGVLDGSQLVKQDRLVGIGGFVDVKKSQIRSAMLPEIQGLGVPMRNWEIAINPHLNLCGTFFLSNFRVTFDFSRRLLHLER